MVQRSIRPTAQLSVRVRMRCGCAQARSASATLGEMQAGYDRLLAQEKKVARELEVRERLDSLAHTGGVCCVRAHGEHASWL